MRFTVALIIGGAATMAASAEPLATLEAGTGDEQVGELLGSGWWDPEENGVWSGREATAVLELPATPPEGAVLLLVGHMLLPPHYDEESVQVRVNGEPTRSVPLGACLVCDIPEAARGRPLTVEIDAAIWPPEAFGDPNGAPLGLKLARVEVHPEPKDPALDLRTYPRHPAAVGAPTGLRETPPADFIRIDGQQMGFETDAGERWVPFGCNYFDPHTGMPPHIWSRFDAEEVERHYALMEQLGVNCVRIFLAAGALLKSPYEMDEAMLRNVDEMLAIAKRHRIRVMFTVADFWETGNYVHSLQPFGSTEQLFSWLSRYCQALGRRYADEPALFAWDLRNEPMVMWDEPVWRAWQLRQWLQAEYGVLPILRGVWGEEAPDSWEAVCVPPNEDAPRSRRLYDYQRFREQLARDWTECQVAGLRAFDRNHPIGVGFIQWSFPAQRMAWDPKPAGYGAFNAEVIADLVDFQMMHFYPMYGDPRDGDRQLRDALLYAQACVEGCHVGQPVILAEYGWYGGEYDAPDREERDAQLAEYCSALIEATKGEVCGWLCWPFADAREVTDLSATGGLVADDFAVKPWGETFRALAAERDFPPQQDLSPPHGGKLTELAPDLLTSLVSCQQYMHGYLRERDPDAGTLSTNRYEMNQSTPSVGWGFYLTERAAEEHGGFDFQWVIGTEAKLSLVLPESATRVRVRAFPCALVPEQWVELTINGTSLPRIDLAQEWRDYEIDLPGGLVVGGHRTEVEFRFAGAASAAASDPGNDDWRPLAAAFDYIDFM